MWLILGVVAFVVLMIIIISVTTGKKSEDDPDNQPPWWAENTFSFWLTIFILDSWQKTTHFMLTQLPLLRIILFQKSQFEKYI